MGTRDARDEDRSSASTPDRVTLKLPLGEAARMHRVMGEMTSSLAEFQSRMEPAAIQIEKTLRRATEAVRPAAEAARRFERQMTEMHPELRDSAHGVRVAVEEAILPALADLQTWPSAPVVSAAETVRILKSMREDLRPLVEATIRTSRAAEAPGLANPGAFADRVLDEVTRPPSPSSSEVEGWSWIAERLNALDLRFGTILALLMTLLVAVRTCRVHDRIESRQQQIIETHEETIERLDRIEGEVLSRDEAERGNGEGQGGPK